MKKITLIIALTTLINSSFYAQGIHIGVGTGTEFLSGEIGYSFSEYLHVGIRASSPLVFNKPASFIGVYARKNFDQTEFGGNMSLRPYLGASVGMLNRAEYTITELSFNPRTGGLNEYIIPAKSSIGFSADLGFEVLYGSSGKFATFTEVKLGQVSNIISQFGNLQNDEKEAKEDAGKTFWGINFGMRFYF